ncbi:MAG: cyclic nucleotide-binding domain-containing protein [Verrucomicrobiota bacterium]
MSESQPEIPALGFASDFSQDERHLMGTFGEFIVADPGQDLIQEGNSQDSLFLVVSGAVHVQTSQTGRTILLNTLRAGDSVGEINIFDPGEASATVSANEFSILWSISRASLKEFMKEHPSASGKLLLSIATQLSKRLREMNEKVAVAQQIMA